MTRFPLKCYLLLKSFLFALISTGQSRWHSWLTDVLILPLQMDSGFKLRQTEECLYSPWEFHEVFSVSFKKNDSWLHLMQMCGGGVRHAKLNGLEMGRFILPESRPFVRTEANARHRSPLMAMTVAVMNGWNWVVCNLCHHLPNQGLGSQVRLPFVLSVKSHGFFMAQIFGNFCPCLVESGVIYVPCIDQVALTRNPKSISLRKQQHLLK